MRPTWVIADVAVTIVPHLTVAIEGPHSVAVHVNLVTAEDECRGMVLVAHGEGVLEPVGDVGTPKERAFDFDLNI